MVSLLTVLLTANREWLVEQRCVRWYIFLLLLALLLLLLFWIHAQSNCYYLCSQVLWWFSHEARRRHLREAQAAELVVLICYCCCRRHPLFPNVIVYCYATNIVGSSLLMPLLNFHLASFCPYYCTMGKIGCKSSWFFYILRHKDKGYKTSQNSKKL